MAESFTDLFSSLLVFAAHDTVGLLVNMTERFTRP